LFEIGFSNQDSVSHRPISQLKRLKFAQPADLTVQQAVMVTNLKTAQALGIIFPLPLLGCADKVIECPLLAQSGHCATEFQCPLSGVKWTLLQLTF